MPLIDPCGLACILSTYLLITYADYILITYMIIPTYGNHSLIAWLLITILNILMGLIVLCQAISAFTNPGRLKKSTRPHTIGSIFWCKMCTKNSKKLSFQSQTSIKPDLLQVDTTNQPYKEEDNNETQLQQVELRVTPDEEGENDKTWCRKCAIFRPVGAHHCSTCGVCIAAMDHHCPWINNCVALRNQKYFVLMLIYTFLTCIYAIILTAIPWLTQCITCPEYRLGNAMFLHSIILVFVCLLMITFALIILYDQIKSVLEQESVIDRKMRSQKSQNQTNQENRLSENRKNKVGCIQALSFMCGTSGPSIVWFIPCIPPHRPEVRPSNVDACGTINHI